MLKLSTILIKISKEKQILNKKYKKKINKSLIKPQKGILYIM
jgi:hypothetical protein